MTQRRSLPPRGEQGNDQRFLTFVLLAGAIFLFSQSMFPPQPAPAPQAAGDADEGDADEGGAAEADAAADQPAPDARAPEIAAAPDVAPQLVAIGSAEVDGPYRMLLTLDNRGAAVTRAELSTHEFRDLDDRSGYLGELGLRDAKNGGAIVGVVGPGTPAAEAGLRVGDVIVSVNGAKKAEGFLGVAGFRAQLSKLEPGAEAALTVRRGDEELPIKVELTRRPLAVMRPESENVRLHSPGLADGVADVPSFVVRLTEAGGKRGDAPELAAANQQLAGGAWEVVESDVQTAVFRKRIADLGIEVEKRFMLAEVPESERENHAFAAYHFEFDVRVRNLLPTPQEVAYAIDGPNGLPIEGWWYATRIGRKENGWGSWGAVGLRDVVARYDGTSFIQYRCSKIVDGGAKPMGQGASMAYLGVDAQYFSVALMPRKASFSEVWFDSAEARLAGDKLPEEGTLPTYNNTTFTANRKAVTLQPAGAEGAEHNDGFRVFAGPKRPDLLGEYTAAGDENYSLHNLLYYGYFSPVVKPMLGLLHFFESLPLVNYGLAIIMLTVVVRGCMVPLSRKQAMNMVKMQELKPEMDRIAEKYKEDMQKRSQAQQELFRKHNYNPMGGCALMFFQLPIFVGLYRALAVDIELRQAPLISESVRFCSNLAAPDQFLDWSAYTPLWWDNGQSFGFFPGLGPYFNLLPIFTIVLFLLQQKMFMPEATTEQAVLQQKLMKYMMIIFGLMFFKVPSGLCLYFIASSLWGITERKLLPKPQPSGGAPAGRGFSKPSSGAASKSAKKKPAGAAKQGGAAKKNQKKKKKKR
ncbi:MAG: membrane protein insertase YidC [Planctomycetota bacterium]